MLLISVDLLILTLKQIHIGHLQLFTITLLNINMEEPFSYGFRLLQPLILYFPIIQLTVMVVLSMYRVVQEFHYKIGKLFIFFHSFHFYFSFLLSFFIFFSIFLFLLIIYFFVFTYY